MKTEAKRNGHIITFYSYKGGTGRSMALSNVAILLAQGKKKVLMVDWDLEAPGLAKYFQKYLSTGFDQQEGLIDFLVRANKELPNIKFDSTEESKLEEFYSYTKDYIVPVKAPNTDGNLFLLKAGRESDENYADQIGSFQWELFFNKIRSFFTKWAYYLSEQYDYVLIDSRTGHTDTGGICTMQMPDKLVLVFTPNHQSFEGTSNLARKAVQYRRRSHDLRPLMVYFLPSRIELNEDKLRTKWLINYQKEITQLYSDLYEQSDISLENYVKRIQVRHASSYAYEEKLAVVEEKVEDKNSLSEVYRGFVGLLRDEVPVWMFGTNGRQNKPVKMFIIYTRQDQEYKDNLMRHLSPLIRNNKLSIWSDSEVIAGELWEKAIMQNLLAADLILVLVSVYTLNSDFIWQVELKEAFKRVERGEGMIIPIILRPCLWIETPLGTFQGLPENAKPISNYANPDEAYTQIASELARKIEQIHHARSH